MRARVQALPPFRARTSVDGVQRQFSIMALDSDQLLVYHLPPELLHNVLAELPDTERQVSYQIDLHVDI